MFGTTFKNRLALHLFNNAALADVGDATGLPAAATAGFFYAALHTADPGVGGSQNTSEVAYTGYGRVPLARSATDLTVTGAEVVNAQLESFGERTDVGSTDALWVSIGTASSGAGVVVARMFLGTYADIAAFTAKADDTITVPGETYVVDQRVAFIPAPGSSLPAGMTEGTVYFVKTVAGEDITISATSGGAAINLTATGSGLICRVTPRTITQGANPQFPAGSLKFVIG